MRVLFVWFRSTGDAGTVHSPKSLSFLGHIWCCFDLWFVCVQICHWNFDFHINRADFHSFTPFFAKLLWNTNSCCKSKISVMLLTVKDFPKKTLSVKYDFFFFFLQYDVFLELLRFCAISSYYMINYHRRAIPASIGLIWDFSFLTLFPFFVPFRFYILWLFLMLIYFRTLILVCFGLTWNF